MITLLALSADDLKKRFYFAISNKIVLAFLLFFSMHVIWLFGSDNLQNALLKIKDFKYILFILIFSMVLQSKFITKIVYGFFLAVFFSALVSFSAYFQFPFIYWFESSSLPLSFAAPFMLSHTQYGSILGLSAGLSLFLLISDFKNSSRLLRFSLIMFFILVSANILIVTSRMGYLLYIVSITIVLLYVYRQYWHKVAIFTILSFTVFFTVGYQYSPPFKVRIDVMFSDIESLKESNFATSFGIRTGYYVYAFSAIRENFIWGVGTSDHTHSASEKIIQVETDKANIDALLYAMQGGHNASLESEYLDITLQFGIIGLVIFLNIFYQLFQGRSSNPSFKGIQLLLVGSMIFLSAGSVIFIASDIGKVFILLSALTLQTLESDTA